MELLSQVNTFTCGMNLDDDVTMIPKNQYRLANNVRLLTDNAGTTGILQNIEDVRQYDGGLDATERILGTTVTRYYNNVKYRVEEAGIVITKETYNGTTINNVWAVSDFNTKQPTWNLIVSATLGLKNKLSIVANYESDKISKIYVTDGNSSIKMINLSNKYNTTKSEPITDPYYFDIIPEAVLFPIQLNTLTSGTLPSGSVQYCFQLFTERGTESAISPVSNVIPLSKDIRNGQTKKILGQLSGESSGLGCVLNITYNNTGQFNRLRVIRIHYKNNISIPEIHVINEVGIEMKSGVNTISYTDNGSQFINVLTIDEFSALVPYDFTAKSLDKLYNRLFASNITENTWDVVYDARAYRADSTGNVKLLSSDGNSIDQNISFLITGAYEVPEEHDCINPYNIDTDGTTTKYIYRNDGLLGGEGPNVSYRFIFAELVLSSTQADSGKPTNDLDLNATAASNKTIKIVYEDGSLADNQEILSDDAVIHNYANAYICANYLGYMRDEIYRFGIVFYNNKGIPSPVHWIGDIRMPSTKDVNDINSCIYPFHTGAYSDAYGKTVEQLAYAMGIQFNVNNVPLDAVSWEIVRCDRTEADRTIVSQGIISSLLEFGNMEGDADNDEYSFGENDIRPMPLFNLSKQFWVKFLNTSADRAYFNHYPRSENYYEFVSPEICVSKNAMLSSVQNAKLNCLYQVATYNHYADIIRDGLDDDLDDYVAQPADMVQLGYKQTVIDTVRDDENPDNDKWFGSATLIGGNRGQLYFHGGSGPGVHDGDGRYWYEKQCLFKYYNIQHDKDETNYQIKDAIVGSILPYENNLNDSKNHAQAIGGKMYSNTSVAGYQQYGNHGINCVLQLDSAFNKTTGYNGNMEQVFNYLNTSYICNIKRNIIPYQGNNYSSRQNSVYISCGSNQDRRTTKSLCFGGDTYLNIFDYLNTSFCQKSNDADEWKSLRMNTVCYIPLESVVNTALFSSESYHNSVNGTMGNNLIQNEPIVLGNGYVQQKPLYEYNTAYSVQSESLKYIPKSMYSIDDLHSGTRITCSELKTNNEVIDSWAKFKFANYLDTDSQYGQITNLKVFKNKLYFFQDSAVGIAAVNERSLITDNNPGELTLGTGGILVRYDYLLTQNGDSIVNDKSITNSEHTLYWHDYDKNVLCALNQNGFSELSKAKKVQTYLNRLPDSARTNPVSFFDKKFNEVWFRIYDRCLIYNENLQVFTSFYTHNPNWFFPFSTKLITVKDNNCYYLHNMYDMDLIEKEERVSYVRFVVNDNVTQTKTFDNQWFTAELEDIEHSNNPHIIKNVFFETRTQETEPIDYTNIEHREDNYRFAIGREKQNDPAHQEQTNASYAGRMRGKYLICNYTFDCNNNREFKLPYIKTTYRYSML